ncbi:AfsR/SARP family transcriptional regulator [Actinophytocola sp.]|uniref:AfsR/SARP family transcriptional regulator n=1 Tax=Actinophytocola sp. TaxID=1872138 RepID=UPI002D268CD2|nr:AfsR/SARP family transcriptional regulator [Actinophytocola sp.]HYQ66801.1 AfsR/SARP family transcriptional regulator [Actinophytocola sp.]
MQVEIRVLGPLEVYVGGTSIVPSASKPSQLLAMLALNPGHPVSVRALTEEIWGCRPPRSGKPTLQTYILKLRRMLAHALAGTDGLCSKDVLVTRRPGYALAVDPDDVDAVRYDRLSAAGRRAAVDGDHEQAARLLTEALGLWRGQALADVPTGPLLGIEAVRLEETRLGDLHLRIEADLRLGRHHQVLGELAAVCARHPMLENFCAQHMVALYRCGRRGEALLAYRGLRATMIGQLGVEPSHRVWDLHQSILRGRVVPEDPSLAVSG